MKMKTSKYWGVHRRDNCMGGGDWVAKTGGTVWIMEASVKGKRISKRFPTEREAAIHADRINLEYGLGKPLNILKPKA